MQIRLDGRVALITGCSTGLGKAMAQKLAAAGADVAIVARRPGPIAEAVREITAAGGRCRDYPDVSKVDDINCVFAAVCSDLERVDILINNAGTSQTGKFEELTDEVWRRTSILRYLPRSALRVWPFRE